MRTSSLLLLGLCAVPFVATLACQTPRDDSPADAGPPSALGTGITIRSITPPATGDPADGIPPNPNHPAQDQQVYITGSTVIIIDNFDETHDGKSIGSMYVQDTMSTAPYSGIDCYKTTFQPPSLIVSPGDVIDLTGEYTDYAYSGFMPGMQYPELNEPVATFRFDPVGTLTPAVIDVNDLNVATQATFDKGNQWTSMLVQVKNVTLQAPGLTNDQKGRITGSITSDTNNGAEIDNELYDMKVTDFPPGTVFSSIVGVVTYFYNFHISPRSAADLHRYRRSAPSPPTAGPRWIRVSP